MSVIYWQLVIYWEERLTNLPSVPENAVEGLVSTLGAFKDSGDALSFSVSGNKSPGRFGPLVPEHTRAGVVSPVAICLAVGRHSCLIWSWWYCNRKTFLQAKIPRIWIGAGSSNQLLPHVSKKISKYLYIKLNSFKEIYIKWAV